MLSPDSNWKSFVYLKGVCSKVTKCQFKWTTTRSMSQTGVGPDEAAPGAGTEASSEARLPV